jgi:hypothetical protein
MKFYGQSYRMLSGIYPPEVKSAFERNRFKTQDYSEMDLK